MSAFATRQIKEAIFNRVKQVTELVYQHPVGHEFIDRKTPVNIEIQFLWPGSLINLNLN